MATDLGELQSKLWEAADQLRANSGLKASEYASPVLGLIFLRYADERFAQAAKMMGPGSARRPTGPEDYQAVGALYLPEDSRFDTLLNLSEDTDIGKAINQAMGGIEVYNPELQGVLPRDYSRIPDDILGELLRLLRALPGAIEGDGFGLIYEYFLGKFAFSEGQKGGEFFTPYFDRATHRGNPRTVPRQDLRPGLRLRRHVRAVCPLRGAPPAATLARSCRSTAKRKTGDTVRARQHEPRRPRPRWRHPGRQHLLRGPPRLRSASSTSSWPIPPSTSTRSTRASSRTTIGSRSACPGLTTPTTSGSRPSTPL